MLAPRPCPEATALEGWAAPSYACWIEEVESSQHLNGVMPVAMVLFRPTVFSLTNWIYSFQN